MSSVPGFTDGTRPRRIALVPHDPKWAAEYEQEAALVAPAFGYLLVSIHHIGSTAIPGIEAKPVIDILAIVSDIELIDRRNSEFERLSYEVMGEFGLPGRRYFRKNSADGRRTHHIHAFQLGSPDVDRHLAFRDFMKAHSHHAREYGALKLELADRFPNNMAAYTAGKSAFIKDMEVKAAAWQSFT